MGGRPRRAEGPGGQEGSKTPGGALLPQRSQINGGARGPAQTARRQRTHVFARRPDAQRALVRLALRLLQAPGQQLQGAHLPGAHACDLGQPGVPLRDGEQRGAPALDLRRAAGRRRAGPAHERAPGELPAGGPEGCGSALNLFSLSSASCASSVPVAKTSRRLDTRASAAASSCSSVTTQVVPCACEEAAARVGKSRRLAPIPTCRFAARQPPTGAGHVGLGPPSRRPGSA
jgi:hypothetical protein